MHKAALRVLLSYYILLSLPRVDGNDEYDMEWDQEKGLKHALRGGTQSIATAKDGMSARETP